MDTGNCFTLPKTTDFESTRWPVKKIESQELVGNQRTWVTHIPYFDKKIDSLLPSLSRKGGKCWRLFRIASAVVRYSEGAYSALVNQMRYLLQPTSIGLEKHKRNSLRCIELNFCHTQRRIDRPTTKPFACQEILSFFEIEGISHQIALLVQRLVCVVQLNRLYFAE